MHIYWKYGQTFHPYSIIRNDPIFKPSLAVQRNYKKTAPVRISSIRVSFRKSTLKRVRNSVLDHFYVKVVSILHKESKKVDSMISKGAAISASTWSILLLESGHLNNVNDEGEQKVSWVGSTWSDLSRINWIKL